MMKGIFRLLNIVAYEHLDETVSQMLRLEKYAREEARAEALEEIQKLDPHNDATKIVDIMKTLQHHLDCSHAKESALQQFINTLKS